MTRVLALDLSLTATGICTDEGHAVYHPIAKSEQRLCEIRDRVLEHAADEYTDHPPGLVVIEDCLVRTPAAAVLGMLHGAVRAALIDHDVPYMVVSPATLKVYGTGKGNAGKPDMRVELLKRTGLDVRDDNAVDARWLWYLANDLLGQPVITLPQTHRRALTKLALPEGVTSAAV